MAEPGAPGLGPIDEEDVTVGLPAVQDGGPYAELSERRQCGRCGTDVWISPGTQVSIESGVYPDAIYCVPCVLQAEDEDDG